MLKRLQDASLKFFSRRKQDLENSDGSINNAAPRGDSKKKTQSETLSTPIKSESDSKEYQVIKLSNGLTATLISDIQNSIGADSASSATETIKPRGKSLVGETPDASRNGKKIKEKLAACSLTIEVGSFSDPEDIQGLAHFLEHMIFMGSKKYPKENKLEAFLSKSGGYMNAFTECEYTSFYFACPEKSLFKAMDIFAHFFVKPLLKWNAVNREREAIDSEFQQVFTDDTTRLLQLLCSLGTEENPARKFTWGNLLTLRDKVTSNRHLHHSLKEFRRIHYSSDRMKLAIQARLPIDTLKSWVTTCFSPITQSPQKATTLKPKELFNMEKFIRFYYVKSIEDVIKVRISWILPSVLRKYRTKPLNYLAFIIGHEGKGSLLSYLKSKLMALELTAGYSDSGLSSNEMYTVFSISIKLTDEGKAAIEEVLTATFSYLTMLRQTGPDRCLFDELKSVNETAFKFQEEADADDNVQYVSVAMLFYPPKDYLRGGDLLFEFSPQEITDFLSRMTPSAANIVLLAKNHQVKLDSEEFWFKTRYCSEPIPIKWMTKWQSVIPYSEFHLPKKNPFITNDFKLIKNQIVTKFPRRFQVTDSVELWYKGDDKFKLPIASISVLIITPKIALSPENWVMTSLFVKVLNHLANEELYSASTANLNYGLSSSAIGLHLMVYGYNQHLGLLVEKLAFGIKNVTCNVNEKIFLAFRKQLARKYYNGTLDAVSLAEDLLDKVRMKPCFSYPEKYAAVKKVSLSGFLEYAWTLLDKVHLQALVQGNMTEQEAAKIVKRIFDIVEPQGCLKTDECFLGKTKIMPDGERCFRLESFNVDDKNCVTTVYYQLGPGTISDFAALTLFVMIMEEPLFNKLRTKLQLGYEVSATTRQTNGILGVSVTVLSQINKFSVQYVKDKIDEFVYGFVKSFPKMNYENFLHFRQSLIDLKNSVDTSLGDEVGRHWDEILKQEFLFDRREKEIDSISKLDLKTVSSLISTLISPVAKEHKKLVVQVVGNDPETKEAKKENLINEKAYVVLNRADSHLLPEKIVYRFLTSKGFPEDYFVRDLDGWYNDLPEYPPHKIIA